MIWRDAGVACTHVCWFWSVYLTTSQRPPEPGPAQLTDDVPLKEDAFVLGSRGGATIGVSLMTSFVFSSVTR